MARTAKFASRLIDWQQRHGRHDLPWQNTRDPYRIWLSEIMLQQTQVATVMAYFQRFVARFPTIHALANALEDDVLTLWSGLGYYSRARNLHRAAKIIHEAYAGEFPRSLDAIQSLPGIGRSTAAAIGAFAFGARCAILDGNVKRVLARYLGIAGYPGEKPVEALLWREAVALLPQDDIETYTQALMDLGATVCVRRNPRCELCPVKEDCVALCENRVKELPSSRPSKALPQKETVMLMIAHKGAVLLEKRPPTGIWGGLWSFPEVQSEDDVAAFCMNQLGLEVRSARPWDKFDHGFTHYKLKITPLPVEVVRGSARAEEPGRLWINFDDAINAAVPKPVKMLLDKLAQSSRKPLPPRRGGAQEA